MERTEQLARRGEDAVKMERNAVKNGAAEASRARVKGNTLSQCGEDVGQCGEDRPPQAGPGLPRPPTVVTARQRGKLVNQIAHARGQVEFWRGELAGGSRDFYRTQKQRGLARAEARLMQLEARLAHGHNAATAIPANRHDQAATP